MRKLGAFNASIKFIIIVLIIDYIDELVETIRHMINMHSMDFGILTHDPEPVAPRYARNNRPKRDDVSS
jgi:hypothetical protein